MENEQVERRSGGRKNRFAAWCRGQTKLFTFLADGNWSGLAHLKYLGAERKERVNGGEETEGLEEEKNKIRTASRRSNTPR